MVEDVDKEADEGRSYEQVAMTKDGDGAMFDSVLTNRDKKNEESLMKSEELSRNLEKTERPPPRDDT